MIESPKTAELVHSGDPIVSLGVAALARAFEGGDACPRHACELYLDRIARHDAAIGAFVAVDAGRARRDAAASARRWARGEARSTIDGVPIGIKANIAVQGLPWTAGIGAWQGRIATRDAACVKRLRDAGAVVLGTVNMDAGALGATTDNPWSGRTRNPYRLDCSPGGSSGGAGAAVAAGLCAAALGTDTMGSVRIPAAACGVFAIVPPVDVIDRDGIVPLAPSFDRVGLLARSLDDAQAVLGAFACVQASDADDGLPLAIFDADHRQVVVDASVRAAHDQLRSRMTAAGFRTIPAVLADYDAMQTVHQLLLLVEVEGAVVYRDLLDQPDALGEPLGSMLRWGAALSTERHTEAAHHLASASRTIRAALDGNAGLASPTMPHPAVAFDTEVRRNTACFTAMASITGLPAVVLPMACDAAGLPQSLQLIARTTDAALRLARRIEPRLEPVLPPPAFRW